MSTEFAIVKTRQEPSATCRGRESQSSNFSGGSKASMIALATNAPKRSGTSPQYEQLEQFLRATELALVAAMSLGAILPSASIVQVRRSTPWTASV
jgi:hypothetical protein